MRTRMPCPTARKAVPMAAVVLPFPGPVFTMMRPRRMSWGMKVDQQAIEDCISGVGNRKQTSAAAGSAGTLSGRYRGSTAAGRVVEPAPNFIVSWFWKLDKPDTGAAVMVCPSHFTLQFHFLVVPGQLKANVQSLIDFNAPRHLDSDAADADVDHDRFDFVAAVKTQVDGLMQPPA